MIGAIIAYKENSLQFACRTLSRTRSDSPDPAAAESPKLLTKRPFRQKSGRTEVALRAFPQMAIPHSFAVTGPTGARHALAPGTPRHAGPHRSGRPGHELPPSTTQYGTKIVVSGASHRCGAPSGDATPSTRGHGMATQPKRETMPW